MSNKLCKSDTKVINSHGVFRNFTAFPPLFFALLAAAPPPRPRRGNRLLPLNNNNTIIIMLPIYPPIQARPRYPLIPPTTHHDPLQWQWSRLYVHPPNTAIIRIIRPQSSTHIQQHKTESTLPLFLFIGCGGWLLAPCLLRGASQSGACSMDRAISIVSL